MVPVHFVRYEDLVSRPKETLSELFCFLLEVESVEGTVIEKRIEDLGTQGNAKNTVYNVKENSQKFNKSVHRYTEAQHALMKKELQDYNYFFGYANSPDEEDTETTFFNYGDD